MFDKTKNPFFEHAEAEYFLAERDGELPPPRGPNGARGACWGRDQLRDRTGSRVRGATGARAADLEAEGRGID